MLVGIGYSTCVKISNFQKSFQSSCKTYASTQRACWSREGGVSIMYVIDLCP